MPLRLIAAVCLLVPALALAAGPEPPAFADQAKAAFAKWDADGNGTLTREEIDRGVADPRVKGPEAAAVVALKRAVRNKKYTLPPLTKDAVAGLAANPGKDRPDLQAMYSAALDRITKADRELFPKGAPGLDTLRQGKLGDCFCLAPLASMVCRDPADVVRMIRPKPDGSYLVNLGAREIAVPPLTDSELALTASAGPGGVWVNVYEKAVGLVRVEKARADGQASPSLIDLLGKGGSAGTTIELVTGNPIVRFSCKYAKDPKTTGREREGKLAELRKLLSSAFAEKRLVTCGTAGGVTTPNVDGNHAYAVVGYNSKSDEILLWNPHGQTFTPKGAAGAKTGYPTKNGRFRVPLSEFVQIFSGVAFEVPPAAR